MSQILIQGMRRSGTTLLYDLMTTFEGLNVYYEPLAMPKSSIGGGSGISDEDFGEHIEKVRLSWRNQLTWPEKLKGLRAGPNALNYGAPSRPSAEFSQSVPSMVQSYLEFLLHSDARVAIKFTRMHHHIDVLKKIAPDGRLLLAVRDPRAVASSYLYGRGQKHRGIYETEQDFFTKSTNRNPWSMRALSNELIGEHYPGKLFSDLERVLLLWKHKNQKMIKDGEDYFESRHKVVRHEDFLLDAPAAMNSVLDFLELKIGAAQHEWAKTNIHGTSSLPYKNSVFWDEVFAKLDMTDLVASLGY